ncbi:hypothetical protein DFH09DRAFT_1264681 [Mycena vulgaris]|nr:hypothetical protein DFH09DRAFT_1264681 [Mycena vulgaris]
MLNHIVKRGVAHLQAASPGYMAKLQKDAELYEEAGPDMEVSPMESLPVLFTGIIFLLILASIRYTLGDVVASLAMIESPSTTAIVEQKFPAYADEEPLIPTEADVDVEITVINRKPITASLIFSRTLGTHIFGHTLFGSTVVSILTPLLLVRTHMLWTHTMIAHPTTKSFLHRIVPRAQCKPLILPTLPPSSGVAHLLGLPNIPEHALHATQRDDPAALALMTMRILAVPLTAALIALFVLLPASATLTRIEAALLPGDMQPIVAFDRAALVGSIDLTARGSSWALFVAAWRSFDSAARVRMLKLYAKMLGAQIAVALVGLQIMAAEVYLELMAIEAQQNKN